MSCRDTAGGSAVSACATALSAGSADEVPAVMHRLRREHQAANPSAANPTAEEAAQVIENLAMRVRHAPGLTDRRRNRVLAKAQTAADGLRAGTAKVPDAHMLHAWKNLETELTPRPNARRTTVHPSLAPSDATSHGDYPSTPPSVVEALANQTPGVAPNPQTPPSVIESLSETSGPGSRPYDRPAAPGAPRVVWAAVGECEYCDQMRREGTRSLPHQPAANCTEGGSVHCTCGSCFGPDA